MNWIINVDSRSEIRQLSLEKLSWKAEIKPVIELSNYI